ncbi:MAG: hypothetical protein KJP18_05120 [Gemmatimonadetes bacterium]|nr:hypothetical protein [Gemmatimonadota bacterium]
MRSALRESHLPPHVWLRRATAFLLTGALVGLPGCGDDDSGDDPVTPTDNPPTITLTAPNGGTAVLPGAMIEITWVANDDNAVVSIDLSYVADGNATGTIASGVTGSSFNWTVPNENLFGVRVRAVAKDAANQTAEDLSDAIFAVVAASARGFVTSSVCQNCHADNVTEVFNSGHPYKLNKVVNGQPPTYPDSDVPSPPQGFTWDEISYVIGGYGYKARFMDQTGNILVTGVTGVQTQYNLPRDDLGEDGLTAAWANYQSGDLVPKPYTCGICHTTGWQTIAENGGVNQDGLPGILGTWEETGITCEQCHGAGLNHVTTQSASNISIDTEKELCGSCHYRDTNHGILASGGFIKHHEQYDEIIASDHVALSCTSCHDSHIGTKYGNAEMGGITVTCESCHTDVTSNAHLVPVDCVSCHMSRASKSARAVHQFEGDIRTHIFEINSDPVGKADMFYVDDGSTFARGFVTLDFACYGCHTDPLTMEGGGASQRTLAELSAKAQGIHN